MKKEEVDKEISNTMNDVNIILRELALKLLKKEDVDILIGYGQSEYSHLVTPFFIKDPGECDKLLFDTRCGMILAKYLLNYPEKRMGIVARPCETRAIVCYLTDGLLQRENLAIIGINNCPGIDDNSACGECQYRNAVIYDYLLKIPDNIYKNSGDKLGTENSLEGLNCTERLSYFQQEFSSCIRCYACREACYACYCKECFTESNQPCWVGKSTRLKDNFTFHLMRSMHLAGRCINCGACELACPEGIDVKTLPSYLSKVTEDLFEYLPGLKIGEKPFLNTYHTEDPEAGFMD